MTDFYQTIIQRTDHIEAAIRMIVRQCEALLSGQPLTEDIAHSIETIYHNAYRYVELIESESWGAMIHQPKNFLEMGHDLMSPLTPMTGYADLLLDGMFGELTATQRHALTEIHSQAEAIRDDVRWLLQTAETL